MATGHGASSLKPLELEKGKTPTSTNPVVLDHVEAPLLGPLPSKITTPANSARPGLPSTSGEPIPAHKTHGRGGCSSRTMWQGASRGSHRPTGTQPRTLTCNGLSNYRTATSSSGPCQNFNLTNLGPPRPASHVESA